MQLQINLCTIRKKITFCIKTIPIESQAPVLEKMFYILKGKVFIYIFKATIIEKINPTLFLVWIVSFRQILSFDEKRISLTVKLTKKATFSLMLSKFLFTIHFNQKSYDWDDQIARGIKTQFYKSKLWFTIKRYLFFLKKKKKI